VVNGYGDETIDSLRKKCRELLREVKSKLPHPYTIRLSNEGGVVDNQVRQFIIHIYKVNDRFWYKAKTTDDPPVVKSAELSLEENNIRKLESIYSRGSKVGLARMEEFEKDITQAIYKETAPKGFLKSGFSHYQEMINKANTEDALKNIQLQLEITRLASEFKNIAGDLGIRPLMEQCATIDLDKTNDELQTILINLSLEKRNHSPQSAT